MQILFFKSLWGMSGDLHADLARIAAAGYDGVEHFGIPPVEPEEWSDLLQRHRLQASLQACVDTAEEARVVYPALAAYGPVSIMSHSGLDRHDFKKGKRLLQTLLQLEEDLSVPVVHETHRRRLFYSPFSTKPYLEEFPSLKVLADFSHWCVVCESRLEGLEEFLEPAIAASHHIHARVGYDEGPQVPNPAAPEYAEFLEAHETWWDAIKAAREADETKSLIVTPEFGPPRYMQTKPFSGEPASDLWEICLWMRDRLSGRWGQAEG